MAQLNPNFEIDFNDINSYEQIQLINDTQLAKENLLMHKAYREPAEDEIIRNQFSSFTFVDFCPKLVRTNQASPRSNDDIRSSSAAASALHGSSSLRANQFELETFSDLFDRVNAWLKLNKDWRVVSMETLVFDCTTQFNHLKSSIHSSTLPRNMRGLRLYLSPSKSRFSGPQKIGCINVIPRKTRGSYTTTSNEPLEYETLDQILARLNELLLTRPIEGRILSVETITLPIVNGYVNTETNYLMDNRLNLLSQRVFSHATCGAPVDASAAAAAAASGDQQQQQKTAGATTKRPQQQQQQQSNGLIDILRVYYEFGAMVCGLVNLIDFLPRFHVHQPSASTSVAAAAANGHLDSQAQFAAQSSADQAQTQDSLPGGYEIDSTESLTRLIKRSLSWFEAERKRFLAKGVASCSSGDACSSDSSDSETSQQQELELHRQQERRQQPVVDLKVCNIQIHNKVLLKSQLVQVTPETALERIRTGQMFHAQPREPIVCQQCASPGAALEPETAAAGSSISSALHEPHEWCSHLFDLNQPYELKFVRLAYVVPVDNKCATRRLASSLRSLPCVQKAAATAPSGDSCSEQQERRSPATGSRDDPASEGEPNCAQSEPASTSSSDSSPEGSFEESDEGRGEEEGEGEDELGPYGDEIGCDDLQVVDAILAEHANAEELAKRVSLEIVHETNRRHRESEQAHLSASADTNLQTSGTDGGGSSQQQQDQQNQLIGQLTYRLFAPCQLVNSSSCFAINPVNSSNPLARRGSVDLNGSHSGGGGGLSSDNATPSTLLLPPSSSGGGGGGGGDGGGGSPGGSLSESTLSINQQPQFPAVTTTATQCKQQIISFGAFFPALSHDIITSAAPSSTYSTSSYQQSGGAGNPSSSSYRFNTNEFESVEAIRRRMEVYVTTNSMKVLAGETLIVNLNDHLSCLSNAIEQTIVKASFVSTRPPSTWVSVYVLYAAVDEPHLPQQLLEQLKQRERLELITEADEEGAAAAAVASGAHAGQCASCATNAQTGSSQGQDNLMPVFEDDFVSDPTPDASKQSQRQQVAQAEKKAADVEVAQVASTMASLNLQDGSIRVELSRPVHQGDDLTSGTRYNSAYDRTVALPTQPDAHLANGYLEPVDFNLVAWPYASAQTNTSTEAAVAASNSLWLDEHDLIDVHSYQLSDSNVRDASKLLRLRKQQEQLAAAAVASGRESLKKGRGSKRGRSARDRRVRRGRKSEDSQCSIM